MFTYPPTRHTAVDYKCQLLLESQIIFLLTKQIPSKNYLKNVEIPFINFFKLTADMRSAFPVRAVIILTVALFSNSASSAGLRLFNRIRYRATLEVEATFGWPYFGSSAMFLWCSGLRQFCQIYTYPIVTYSIHIEVTKWSLKSLVVLHKLQLQY